MLVMNSLILCASSCYKIQKGTRKRVKGKGAVGAGRCRRMQIEKMKMEKEEREKVEHRERGDKREREESKRRERDVKEPRIHDLMMLITAINKKQNEYFHHL